MYMRWTLRTTTLLFLFLLGGCDGAEQSGDNTSAEAAPPIATPEPQEERDKPTPDILSEILGPYKLGAMALTAGECTGLGGKVVNSRMCGSGKKCYRVNEHGAIFSKCLEAESAESAAVPKKKEVTNAAGVVITGLDALPLTILECLELGGNLHIDYLDICLGAVICETTDQSKDHYYECINESD